MSDTTSCKRVVQFNGQGRSVKVIEQLLNIDDRGEVAIVSRGSEQSKGWQSKVLEEIMAIRDEK